MIHKKNHIIYSIEEEALSRYHAKLTNIYDYKKKIGFLKQVYIQKYKSYL